MKGAAAISIINLVSCLGCQGATSMIAVIKFKSSFSSTTGFQAQLKSTVRYIHHLSLHVLVRVLRISIRAFVRMRIVAAELQNCEAAARKELRIINWPRTYQCLNSAFAVVLEFDLLFL